MPALSPRKAELAASAAVPPPSPQQVNDALQSEHRTTLRELAWAETTIDDFRTKLPTAEERARTGINVIDDVDQERLLANARAAVRERDDLLATYSNVRHQAQSLEEQVESLQSNIEAASAQHLTEQQEKQRLAEQLTLMKAERDAMETKLQLARKEKEEMERLRLAAEKRVRESQSAAADAVLAEMSQGSAHRSTGRGGVRRRLITEEEEEEGDYAEAAGRRGRGYGSSRGYGHGRGRGYGDDGGSDCYDESYYAGDGYGDGEGEDEGEFLPNESNARRLEREYHDRHARARDAAGSRGRAPRGNGVGQPSPLRRGAGSQAVRTGTSRRLAESQRLRGHERDALNQSRRRDRYSDLDDADESCVSPRRGRQANGGGFTPTRASARAQRRLQASEAAARHRRSQHLDRTATTANGDSFLSEEGDTLMNGSVLRHSIRDSLVAAHGDPQLASELASLRDEAYRIRAKLKQLLNTLAEIVRRFQRSHDLRAELEAELVRVRRSHGSPSKRWREETIRAQQGKCDLEIERCTMEHEQRLAEYKRLEDDYRAVMDELRRLDAALNVSTLSTPIFAEGGDLIPPSLSYRPGDGTAAAGAGEGAGDRGTGADRARLPHLDVTAIPADRNPATNLLGATGFTDDGGGGGVGGRGPPPSASKTVRFGAPRLYSMPRSHDPMTASTGIDYRTAPHPLDGGAATHGAGPGATAAGAGVRSILKARPTTQAAPDTTLGAAGMGSYHQDQQQPQPNVGLLYPQVPSYSAATAASVPSYGAAMATSMYNPEAAAAGPGGLGVASTAGLGGQQPPHLQPGATGLYGPSLIPGFGQESVAPSPARSALNRSAPNGTALAAAQPSLLEPGMPGRPFDPRLGYSNLEEASGHPLRAYGGQAYHTVEPYSRVEATRPSGTGFFGVADAFPYSYGTAAPSRSPMAGVGGIPGEHVERLARMKRELDGMSGDLDGLRRHVDDSLSRALPGINRGMTSGTIPAAQLLDATKGDARQPTRRSRLDLGIGPVLGPGVGSPTSPDGGTASSSHTYVPGMYTRSQYSPPEPPTPPPPAVATPPPAVASTGTSPIRHEPPVAAPAAPSPLNVSFGVQAGPIPRASSPPPLERSHRGVQASTGMGTTTHSSQTSAAARPLKSMADFGVFEDDDVSAGPDVDRDGTFHDAILELRGSLLDIQKSAESLEQRSRTVTTVTKTSTVTFLDDQDLDNTMQRARSIRTKLEHDTSL